VTETTDPPEPKEAHPTDDELPPLPPVVVDLGKVKNKRIKQLKRGEGPLLEELDDVVAAIEEELADEIGDRAVLPVVVLYRKKEKRRRPLF
jgi:hypothetical protein